MFVDLYLFGFPVDWRLLFDHVGGLSGCYVRFALTSLEFGFLLFGFGI